MNVNIPAAPEFEKTVIGAILNEPNQMTEIASFLSPECFYDPKNAQIYGIIQQMYDANEQIDLYTVVQRCNAVPGLKAAGIVLYLTDCTQSVGSGAHLASHAQIVKDAYVRRNILASAQRLIAKASGDSEDLSDTLAYLSEISDTVNGMAAGGSTAQHIGKSLTEALRQAEKRQVLAQSGTVSGITSGLAGLDRMTGGWQPSTLNILAARPSAGKTALMLHLAKAAAKAGVPVCIYSLEMANVSLMNRLILSESNVDADAFRSGRLTAADWQEMERATARLSSLPIYVDDNPMVSMRYIKARSKIMQKRGQCGMIMVDYLQLADTATDKKNRNREQEIAQASRQAKIIAKELGVPFILLSQLSRECEKRADKTPILSDLRESGAIEQDADIVAFIHRPAYYGIKEIETEHSGVISTHGLGVLFIAKQRDGATGAIPFSHNPSMTKITDYKTSGQSEPDNEPF